MSLMLVVCHFVVKSFLLLHTGRKLWGLGWENWAQLRAVWIQLPPLSWTRWLPTCSCLIGKGLGSEFKFAVLSFSAIRTRVAWCIRCVHNVLPWLVTTVCLISEPQSKGTHGVTGFCCVLISDVTVYEDQWVGETVLQSTFTSQLVNLGSYSHVRPEKCKIYFE